MELFLLIVLKEQNNYLFLYEDTTVSQKVELLLWVCLFVVCLLRYYFLFHLKSLGIEWADTLLSEDLYFRNIAQFIRY